MRALLPVLLASGTSGVALHHRFVVRQKAQAFDAREDFSALLADAAAILGTAGSQVPPKAWEGGFTPKIMEKYHKYATNPEVGTICETGFGKGISALYWLSMNENATLHSFDFNFPESTVNFLRKKFGAERLQLHKGDAGYTLPGFDTRCDVISIDGNHEKGGSYEEINLLRKNAHSETVLLADDMFNLKQFKEPCTGSCNECNCAKNGFANEFSKGWIQHVNEDHIQTLGCADLSQLDSKGVPSGYCHGRFIGTKSTCNTGLKCMAKNAFSPVYCSYMSFFHHWHC